MPSLLRMLVDMFLAGLALWVQWKLVRRLWDQSMLRHSDRFRVTVRAALVLTSAWIASSVAYSLLLSTHMIEVIPWMDWARAGAVVWCVSIAGIVTAEWLFNQSPGVDRDRRRFLAGTLCAAPVAVAGAGVFIERTDFRVAECDIPVPQLPADLDGLRIALLSDIHLGPFLEESELERVVAMTNEVRPHLTAVTGDLITRRDSRLSDCLRILKGLRADAGTLGCLGNHEESARCEARAKREGARAGIDFLRGESRMIRFGNALVNIAGVDYQAPRKPYLAGAERLRSDGHLNLLLSHNPDVFPVAARQGWDLTLSGHTHGGQVTMGFLHQYANLARIFTPYVYGPYSQNGSALYVTRGIGTVAVPARIGAPPEIGLIKLCAT